MRLMLLLLLNLTLSAPVVSAEGRSWIGTARIFNNDFLGDGRDRWRSGSYTYSHLRGREPYTGVPQEFGDILEYRFHSEIISASGGSAFPGDRPYVGALSFGILSHFGEDAIRYMHGIDVTAIGPQTGISEYQEGFHNRYGFLQPPFVNQQLDNAIWLTAHSAAARHIQFSENVSLRPFAAAQYGAENLVRLGFDVRFAGFGHDALLVRDTVTGHLSLATKSEGTGLSLVAGADIAFVASSNYLPAAQGFQVRQDRARARVGLGYQFSRGRSLFYGATYLSPEFEGQSEGQVLGSLRLNFTF
jgi:hypothetical protein